MKVGDLVRHIKMDSGIGIVTHTEAGWSQNQIIVRWTKPIWYNKQTGLAHEYSHNLEIISEA